MSLISNQVVKVLSKLHILIILSLKLVAQDHTCSSSPEPALFNGYNFNLWVLKNEKWILVFYNLK